VNSRGDVYIADNLRIRKIDAATGLISSVAGDGRAEYWDSIGSASSVAVAPDGAIYFTAGKYLWTVGSDGRVTIVAGSGGFGRAGDGGKARLASTCTPSGAVATGSVIYFSDCGRLRVVDRGSGVVQTLAGGGNDSPMPGAEALTIQFSSIELAVIRSLCSLRCRILARTTRSTG
jgi:hypothetical protein